MPKHTVAQINSLSRNEFVGLLGPVFENSPWIAEATWPARPFADLNALHQALCRVMREAGEGMQESLIRAHPDLVGRAALAGTLTSASNREQASAGLDRLSADEIAVFQKYNEAYRSRFGFPFVICARLNRKDAILKGFEQRLKNEREREIDTALAEIEKIARLRLEDLIA